VNTELATLTGFEAYAEAEVSPWVTPYSTVTMVQGVDRTRNGRGVDLTFQVPSTFPNGAAGQVTIHPTDFPNKEPLPNIAPPEARVGVKLHEGTQSPTYGVDLSARMVAKQMRVAGSLLEEPTAGFVVYDLRTFWQVRKGILLTAGVENVFDRFYREHLDLRTGRGVFQPGRNAYFGAEFRY
jgi:outer membrane receptor protein involved in Fe transport